MKEKYKILLVAAVLLVISVWLFFVPELKTSVYENEEAPLKVTLLKVGKADAIVVQSEQKTMVIDAGEEKDGEELVDFLVNQGISCVDVLVITHYDRDHVGGADTLIEKMDVGRVLLPDYVGSNTEYTDFMDAMEQKKIKPELLTRTIGFELGEAVVQVEPPASYEVPEGTAEVDNNFSLITMVIHGKNRFLFTGDAQKQRIREWTAGGSAQVCGFLKVPHHGVYNTALQELIDSVKPEYAVVCSSAKNPADVRTLELLKKNNVSVFQTKDGNVTVISDGNSLEVHQTLEK